MFGVNAVEMTKALIKPRIKVGSEYVHKGQNAGQVSCKFNIRFDAVTQEAICISYDLMTFHH